MIALQLFISLIILLASLCYYGFKLKSFINSETPQKFEIEDIISYIIITELKTTNSDTEYQHLQLYLFPTIGTGHQNALFLLY